MSKELLRDLFNKRRPKPDYEVCRAEKRVHFQAAEGAMSLSGGAILPIERLEELVELTTRAQGSRSSPSLKQKK